MSTVAERVARGVELLDNTDPDWLYEIDLETLDVAEATDCILGQQPGGFAETAVRLGLAYRDGPERYDGPEVYDYRLRYLRFPDYGFAAFAHQRQHDVDAEYAELQQEWVRVITERRAADAAAAAGK